MEKSRGLPAAGEPSERPTDRGSRGSSLAEDGSPSVAVGVKPTATDPPPTPMKEGARGRDVSALTMAAKHWARRGRLMSPVARAFTVPDYVAEAAAAALPPVARSRRVRRKRVRPSPRAQPHCQPHFLCGGLHCGLSLKK